MGTSEVKIMIIGTVPKKLNFIKEHEIWRKFWKVGSRVIGVTLMVTTWDNVLGLGEPYTKTPLDIKSVLSLIGCWNLT